MNQLPPNTIRLLTSTQAVSGVSSIVKELFENSLDASSSSVEIKLENYGLDRIEVKDNGAGVSISDIPYMAKKHYTSKISSHADLSYLETLGFRGEALGAVAAISDLAVTTRCTGEKVGRSYKLNLKGDITSETNIPTTVGTSVIISQLYKNIPVRRQYYSAAKRKKDELKAVIDLLMSYGLAYYGVRIVLKHNKSVIWQKSNMSNMSAALSCILTPAVASHLQQHLLAIDEGTSLDMYLTKPESGSIDSMYRTSSDKLFIFVNKRPITDKDVEKILRSYMCKTKNNKYPTCCVQLTTPSNDVDVNLEPNKTKVLLANKEKILKKLEEFLESIYDSIEKQPRTPMKAPTYHSINNSHASSDETLTENEASVLTPSKEGFGIHHAPIRSVSDGSRRVGLNKDIHNAVYVADNTAKPVSIIADTNKAGITDGNGPGSRQLPPSVLSLSSDSGSESDSDVFSKARPHVSVSQCRDGNPETPAEADLCTSSKSDAKVERQPCQSPYNVSGVDTLIDHDNSVDLFANNISEDNGTDNLVENGRPHVDLTCPPLTDQATERSHMTDQQGAYKISQPIENHNQSPSNASENLQPPTQKVAHPTQRVLPEPSTADKEFLETFTLTSSEDEDDIPLFSIDNKTLPGVAAVARIEDGNTPTNITGDNPNFSSSEKTDTQADKDKSCRSAGGFKHWSFSQKGPDITGVPSTPGIQPVTSTQKCSDITRIPSTPDIQPVTSTQKDSTASVTSQESLSTSDSEVMVIGSSVCNLYNSQSVCQASTPVRQTQLTKFCEPIQRQHAESDKSKTLGNNNNSGDIWARGEMLDDFEPVTLFRPPARQTHTSEPAEGQGQTKACSDDKRRPITGHTYNHVVSMIREETIPDGYRKFVKTASKKRRLTEQQQDRTQPTITSSLNRTSLGCMKPSQRTDLCRTVEFSIQNQQNKYRERLRQAGKPQSELPQPVPLVLCGTPCTTTGAIVLSGNELYALNPFRYKEIEMYQQALVDSALKPVPLNSPVKLTADLLSPEAWAVLISLPVNSSFIDHQALSMNGFTISADYNTALTASDGGTDNAVACNTEYTITAVTDQVPGYGYISDLDSLLSHISQDGGVYRPLKIIHHVQSEVVRKGREIKSVTREELITIIGKLNLLDSDVRNLICEIHSKSVLTQLSTLPALR